MKKRITKAPTAGAVTVNFSEAGIFDIATTVGTVITAAVNVNHINSSKLIIATGAGAVSFPAGGNYIILSGEYEVNKTNYIYIHCIDTTTPKFFNHHNTEIMLPGYMIPMGVRGAKKPFSFTVTVTAGETVDLELSVPHRKNRKGSVGRRQGNHCVVFGWGLYKSYECLRCCWNL